MKSWIINNILKEMTDGFYVDIYPENDEVSSTKLLDESYRWRGLCITDKQINRSNFCNIFNIDVNNSPITFVSTLQTVMVGRMIHFMSINNVKNIENMFDVFYDNDIACKYIGTRHYWKRQIIGLEIMSVDTLSDTLFEKLNKYFNLKLFYNNNNEYRFINELYSILTENL